MSTGELKNVHASPNSVLSRSFYCPQKADFAKIANFSTFAFTNMRFILYTMIKDRAQGVPEYSIYKEFVLCTILVLT